MFLLILGRYVGINPLGNKLHKFVVDSLRCRKDTPRRDDRECPL